jgi:transaldolase
MRFSSSGSAVRGAVSCQEILDSLAAVSASIAAIHAAAANKRSVNSELLFMLERAYLEAPEANPAAILRPQKAPHGAGLWF